MLSAFVGRVLIVKEQAEEAEEMNEYTYGEVIANKLRELRAQAARERRALAARRRPAGLRYRLGGMLILAGRQLAGQEPAFKVELTA